MRRLLIIGLLAASTAVFAQNKDCKIEHFAWSNRGDYVMIEGVVAPTSVRVVYIQAFDRNGKYLGNATGVVNPGGTFEAIVDRINPTSELRIKYACE